MSKGITWPGYKGEPRSFAGIPGTYAPGVVVPLVDAGMTEDEAAAAIAGTPLALVDLKEPKTKGGD